ncbi:VMAP-C domain-containing protein [Phytohabitans rumicis]|uniref:Uncharacterized protein n=1 Tax=Phytohabitans rumicis TaxID=1076125 RepID=A0A6V8LLW7_9ACTN|nr:hypothetical protein [Phytohabitans rumicis]GFJ95087.1 hypothetical protein Prum_087290 [Phytohabitans rumicis]
MSALLRDAVVVRVDDDPHDYRIGHLDSIDPNRPHRVALTTMALDNTRNAATTCTDLLRTFPSIRCVLLTGIAGGVPAPQHPERHVRLGDVVVPVSGVVDYGHTRERAGVAEPRRPLGGLSMAMLRAVRRIQQSAYTGAPPAWQEWLLPAREQPMATFARPPATTDQLHAGDNMIDHPAPAASGHVDGEPKIHYGRIGCADVLQMDEKRRDDLATRHEVLAFEMESAGVAASATSRGVEWFMVRGVVDYCDRHKTDRWHPYASLTAAGFTRRLLADCRPFPVWRTVTGSGVIALMSDQQADRLVALLDEAPPLDLPRLWRAAVGNAVPMPAAPPDNVTDLFHHLLGVNANAENLPPALAAAEEVATHCDSRLASRIRDCVDQVALQLQIVEAVRRRRGLAGPRAQPQPPDPAPAAPIRPCLLIQIERDGIDQQACEVRYWIQRRSDSWDPEPGEPRRTTFQRVERVMQEAIRHAESVWRDGQGPFEIELLLPTDLLHEAVEWWRTELEEPAPTPLCLDYPIVVRSLDRMRATFRHRVWADRWKALWRPPARHRLYWGRPATDDSLDQWNAVLRTDTEITTVSLGTSPERSEGGAELRSALNAGVPVILWDRRVPLDSSTIRLIEKLAEDEPELLRDRLAELRRAAATAADQPHHPGRHLALLWDDPERTVYEGPRS